jgi:4-hydroxybenzoate polyprenyltransferase
LISPQAALALVFVLVALSLALVATLPYPNSLYLLLIMPVSLLLEVFYQVRKRQQRFPIAQLVGRIDVTLFPVAGYLCAGHPDRTALACALFFYPWILAHLGLNDLVDIENDRARGMKSIAVLFGMKGTSRWILAFTLLHIALSPLLLASLGWLALTGFVLGFLTLGLANYKVMKDKSQEAGLAALPLFHLTMAIYVVSIILDYSLLP